MTTWGSPPPPALRLDHLDALEAESIRIIREVVAEFERPVILYSIGKDSSVSTSRPLVFDGYAASRATGSFILIDPATNFTAGAGMIAGAAGDRPLSQPHQTAAERLVRIARSAPSDRAAADAVRRALEEMFA